MKREQLIKELEKMFPIRWNEDVVLGDIGATPEMNEEVEMVEDQKQKSPSIEELLGVQITCLDEIFIAVRDAKEKLAEAIGEEPASFESLTDFRDTSYAIAKEKGWHDNDTDDFPTKIALMHSELSETLEEYRNGRGYNEIYYNDAKPDKPEGIPVELADVLIRVMDLCGKFNIDIEKAVRIKTEYNKSRPHRHGGKKI